MDESLKRLPFPKDRECQVVESLKKLAIPKDERESVDYVNYDLNRECARRPYPLPSAPLRSDFHLVEEF